MLEKFTAEVPDLREFYIDLCTCGVGDWSVPNSFFDGRRTGWTTQNLFLPALEGLVFDARFNRTRSGHHILSSAILEAASVSRAPRLLQIAEIADPDDPAERRFAIGSAVNR